MDRNQAFRGGTGGGFVGVGGGGGVVREKEYHYPSVENLPDFTHGSLNNGENERVNFIHLQCWEVLPFLAIQRQQCIQGPQGTGILHTAGAESSKRAAPPSTGGAQNQSPRKAHAYNFKKPQEKSFFLKPSFFGGLQNIPKFQDPQSQKIARTAPKNFLNNSRVLPVICQQNKGFEANRTRKFTRTFGKIFVTEFLCGTFSVPKHWWKEKPSFTNMESSVQSLRAWGKSDDNALGWAVCRRCSREHHRWCH